MVYFSYNDIHDHGIIVSYAIILNTQNRGVDGGEGRTDCCMLVGVD